MLLNRADIRAAVPLLNISDVYIMFETSVVCLDMKLATQIAPRIFQSGHRSMPVLDLFNRSSLDECVIHSSTDLFSSCV